MGKVLAVASAGGHWVQLMRLVKAFERFDVVYVSTSSDLLPPNQNRFFRISDGNRWELSKSFMMMLESFVVVAKVRPDVVVTTGAAPGLAIILWAKLFQARTIWIDSIANSEQLSGSGRIAKFLATKCLTQWPNLADGKRVEYWGGVL